MAEHTTGTEKSHHHHHYLPGLLYSHAGPEQGSDQVPGLANQNQRISGATIKKAVKSSEDDLLDEIFATGKRDDKSFILNEKDKKDTRPPTAPISMNRSEVCIIGAGICGLVLARELVKRGINVAILEATSRDGGHIESECLYDDLVIEYGAEWFDVTKHRHVAEEVKRYGLTIIEEVESTRTMFSYCQEKRVSLDRFPVKEDELENYNSIVTKMEYAASQLNKFSGFDQLDNLHLDQNFSEYLESLGPSDTVREFFLSRAGRLLRTPPHMFSALQFIKLLQSFADETVGGGVGAGGVDRFLRGNFCRVKEGFSELIKKIKADVLRLDGVVQYNFPVQSIIAIKEVIQVVAYRDNGTQYMVDKIIDTIKVSINEGSCFICNVAISCIPMKCLSNITFIPSLQDYVNYGLSKSNIGDNCSDFTKVFITARGVSNISRVFASGPVVFEAKVIARDIDARKIAEKGRIISGGEARGRSLICSQSFADSLENYPQHPGSSGGGEVSVGFQQGGGGGGGGGGIGVEFESSDFEDGDSLSITSAKSGAKADKKSKKRDSEGYSEKSEKSEKSENSEKSDRGSDSMYKEKKGKGDAGESDTLSLASSKSNTGSKKDKKSKRNKRYEKEDVKEELKEPEIVKLNQDVALMSLIIPEECINNRELIAKELKKYHPTLCDIGWVSYREYYTDVWLKGASFSLRKGMSQLYDEMCLNCRFPFKELAKTQLNESSSNMFAKEKSTGNKAMDDLAHLALPPVGYKGNYSLHSTSSDPQSAVKTMNFVIGGAEFCSNGWTGWVDGAVQNAYENAKYVANKLRPPDIDYNNMRRFLRSKDHEYKFGDR